jgi:transposase
MAPTLTDDERTELEPRVRSLKIRAEDAGRARVILMLADGASYSMIEAALPCYRDYIDRWRRRFLGDRLDGLRARFRGPPPTVLTPAMEARVLEKTRASAARWQHALEYAQAGTRADEFITISWRGRGSERACSPIASSATGSRTIRISRRRPPTSSGRT